MYSPEEFLTADGEAIITSDRESILFKIERACYSGIIFYLNIRHHSAGRQRFQSTAAQLQLHRQGVTLGLSVSDGDTTGYSMLIYGDIGSGVFWKVGAATWEAYSATKSITLKTTDGSKTVKAKVKDDVGNVSTEATVTVTLDTTVPVVTITGPDHAKISSVSGSNESVFSFYLRQCIYGI